MQEMRDPGLLAPERLLVPSTAAAYPAPPPGAPEPAVPATAPPIELPVAAAEMAIPDHLADLIADERQRLTAIEAAAEMPPYASPSSSVAAEGYRT